VIDHPRLLAWFEASDEDCEKDRMKRLGADAETPHRIKCRKIHE
jgi:hypothetical protein